MICDDIRRLAYFFIDGELPADRLNEFSTHLHDCPGCGDRVSMHRRLRALVQRRLARVTAPDALRRRIHDGLRASATAPQPELA